MDAEFTSYAFQDLPRKKIKRYAAQYACVDMTLFLRVDENNFPFLIHAHGDDDYHLMIWNSDNGIMEHTDEDPVRAYAIVQFIRDRAYPIFDSLDSAQQWAREHQWPRKRHDA